MKGFACTVNDGKLHVTPTSSPLEFAAQAGCAMPTEEARRDTDKSKADTREYKSYDLITIVPDWLYKNRDSRNTCFKHPKVTSDDVSQKEFESK